MCGEHAASGAGYVPNTGSSPRVRGTRDQHREGASFQGIIPACAGNTRCPAARRALSRDHPRVCGEHSRWTDPEEGTVESSPRVRGTQGCSAGRVKVSGIIPACAGNTGHLARSPLPTRDHPRVCGEHVVSFVPVSSRTGSSPRVRGTRIEKDRPEAVRGIIPACAGNTRRRTRRARIRRDHPRVCGEHTRANTVPALRSGSSPRVRGTLPVSELGFQLGGIIPACAGNTR